MGRGGRPFSPMIETLFVAPWSGVLGVIPFSAVKWDGPLSSNAHLSIQLSDTTYELPVLSLMPFHTYGNALRDSCQVVWITQRHFYCALSLCLGYSGVDTFYTRAIQSGDTVRFAFQDEYYDPTRNLVPVLDNLWSVSMSTPLPQGCVSGWDIAESHSAYFFFADTLVKITRPDSVNVYPYYPAIHNDTVTIGAKKRFIDLELKVQYADSAISNYWVQLDTAVLADSGGHSHDGTRPKPKYIVPKLSGVGVDTITSGARKTDSTGVLRFKFLASQFGGVERIRVRLLSDTTKWDTLSVITRVPGLQLLPVGTNYIKYGGRCEHHGPQAPSGCTTPDTDHWGTADIIQSVIAIADSFAAYYTNFRIRVNDMSLPLGGGFDIEGNWEADIIDEYPQSGDCNDVGHCEHREGTVADISFSVLNPSGQVITMTPEQSEDMLGIIQSVAGAPLEHGHYHIGQE